MIFAYSLYYIIAYNKSKGNIVYKNILSTLYIAVTLFVQNNIMISEVYAGGNNISTHLLLIDLWLLKKAERKIYVPQIFRR